MRQHAHGFTLLEILVSLTILSIAMAALIRSAGSFVGNQASLRDRTVAEWVARNHLVEQQVKKDWPSIGQEKGDIEYAGRDWRWVMQVTQTVEKDLRRLDIEVFPAEDKDSKAPISTLSGFIAKKQ